MPVKPHKHLVAWKTGFDLVLDVYRITCSFPPDEKYGITSQIRSAAVSIPLNIAEGAARKSPEEFINFLSMALGSVAELDTLILLSKELKFVQPEVADELIIKLDTIGKIIYGLMKKLGYFPKP
jgi:four helix bundle protein